MAIAVRVRVPPSAPVRKIRVTEMSVTLFFLSLIFAGNRPLSPAGYTAKAPTAYCRVRNKSSALSHRRKAGHTVCPGGTIDSRRLLKKRLAKQRALAYTFSAAEVVELVDTLS